MTDQADFQTEPEDDIDEAGGGVEQQLTELDQLIDEEHMGDEAGAADEADDETFERDQAMARLATAGFMLNGIQSAIRFKYPHYQMSDEAKLEGMAALDPLIDDFSESIPDWALPYIKYFQAGAFVLGCVSTAKAQASLPPPAPGHNESEPDPDPDTERGGILH